MSHPIARDLDALLTRRQAAEALTARGYPLSERTLSTKASRGGGPIYCHFGPRVLYRWADLLEWAESRLGPRCRSTAEADAPHPQAAA